MNKSFYTFLIIILFFGLAVYFFVWPAYQGVVQVRQGLTDWQAKLGVAREGKVIIEKLKADYGDLKDSEEKIMEAVPKKEDLPGLLIQLDALASQNGLILNSLSFDSASLEKKATAAAEDTGDSLAGLSAVISGSALASSVIEKMAVSAKLNGSYNGLKNFLLGVENNLRLADVTSVDFSQDKAAEPGVGESGSISVNLNFYYKK